MINAIITDPNLVDDYGYIDIADSDIKTNEDVKLEKIYEEQRVPLVFNYYIYSYHSRFRCLKT